jgi:predicted AlkP superfamily phosphohydrolase/phosphomutase
VTRTIAIALDGCSWNVLEPLLDTGELPHLQSLRERGASGVLESSVPFVTGPAWASFATGASPPAHGVYDFLAVRGDGSLATPALAELRRRTYHQQLGQEGKRSVLINAPADHYGCEGAVIVNGWLTDDETRRILPVGRRERYRRLLEAYRTFPRNSGDIDELCTIEQARFDLARELFLAERWHHFFVLFSSTDWLAHHAAGWFLRGDSDARAAFLRLYRQLDTYTGWFLEHAGDATAVVFSDHGQCEEEAVFRVNAVLRDLGLVVPEHSGTALENGTVAGRWSRPRTVIRVPDALGRSGSNRLVGPLARLTRRALLRGLGIAVTRPTHEVDHAASRAFSPTQTSCAIYARDCTDEEVEGIRDAILSVRLPDGRAAVDGVWTLEELYGRADPDGPTLLFSPARGVRPSALVREEVVGPPVAAGRGWHQRDGILLIDGPAVRPVDLGRCSICDIAPTLLWAMGSKIVGGGDGRILFEAFERAFADGRPVVETDAAAVESTNGYGGHSEEVVGRLKALGYI